jgi:2-hydroxychromene-2-carboxylate isomerase
MADKTVEFFWDVGSPYTFLASTRIEDIARSCGASVEWRPFLLGGVFKETGNRPPVEVPAKGQYMLDDLKTWAAFYGLSFQFPTCFPVNSLVPMRAALAAQRLGKGSDFALAIMRLYWMNGEDPSQPESVEKVCKAVGLDAGEVTRLAQDPAVKDQLRQNTEEAVKRGAFGAPTFFVGDKMFWGNDRLPLLEAHLKGQLQSRG